MNSEALVASIMNVPVVGVAIGLMFTYLIVSLVSSTISESVAGVFQWRGTYLQKGIGVLLSNTSGTSFSWGGITNWLIAHATRIDPTQTPSPAVAVATTTTGVAAKAVAAIQAAAAARAAADAAPSAAATAAVTAAGHAVTDAGNQAANAVPDARAAAGAADVSAGIAALATAAADAAEKVAAASVSGTAADASEAAVAVATAVAALRVYNVQNHPLLKGTPTRLPSYVPARDFATALLDTLRDGSANPAFSQIERTVAALPDGDIKQILTAFVQDAAGDLDKLRARIESWFDDAMDRLSGIYKRFSHYFLLALGLVIAVGLNVDSVHLALALWQQPALRAQIVAQAQAAVPPSNASNAAAANPAPQDPAAPAAGATPAAAPGNSPTPPAPDKPASGMLNVNPASPPTLQQAMQQVENLPLPVGRAPCASFFGEATTTPPARPATAATATTPAQPAVCARPAKYPSGWCGWNWWTIVGWLITAFAISLGAPFWFGLLQNVMNLRAAGTPPKRAPGSPP